LDRVFDRANFGWVCGERLTPVNFHWVKNEIDLGAMSDQGKTAISTKEAPAAIGPYSQAVRVGDMLFASGQVALDPATGQIVAGGITEQTTRVLENVKAVLAKAGLDMVHVVKTTVFLKTMGDFAAMNAVYAKYLAPEGAVPPARSTVAVAGLPKDALVEIEVIAKDSSGSTATLET
jgi:2-iminobutanoate/2-iminopropanoate deaminase